MRNLWFGWNRCRFKNRYIHVQIVSEFGIPTSVQHWNELEWTIGKDNRGGEILELGWVGCWLTLQHVIIRVISDREEMGRHLSPPLATVFGNHIVGVDRQALVGVDHNTEEPRIGLRLCCGIQDEVKTVRLMSHLKIYQFIKKKQEKDYRVPNLLANILLQKECNEPVKWAESRSG